MRPAIPRRIPTTSRPRSSRGRRSRRRPRRRRSTTSATELRARDDAGALGAGADHLDRHLELALDVLHVAACRLGELRAAELLVPAGQGLEDRAAAADLGL